MSYGSGIQQFVIVAKGVWEKVRKAARIPVMFLGKTSMARKKVKSK